MHLDIKKDFDRFSGRLDYFMSLSNVVVVAPGGVGTLLELAYTWQLVQVRDICTIPIILLGTMWKEFMEWVEKWPLKKKFLDAKDLHLIFLAKTPKEAMHLIEQAHKHYQKGAKNVCFNLKKYALQ